MENWHQRLEHIYRTQFGWSFGQMAAFFGVSRSTAHGWVMGDQPIPDSVKGWIMQTEEALREQDQAQQAQTAQELLKVGIVGAGLFFLAWATGKWSGGEEEED